MGQSKSQRRKYKTPSHPWNRQRIAAERELLEEYGLVNKKEIMRIESLLRNLKTQAKELITRSDKQAELEWEQLRARLNRLGLVDGAMKIEQVLDLSMKNIMERRLQTQVVRKGLARSMMQARQFITHQHILVGSHKISVPGHFVSANEENMISFASDSSYADMNHPERMVANVAEPVDDATEGKPAKKGAKKVAKNADKELKEKVSKKENVTEEKTAEDSE